MDTTLTLLAQSTAAVADHYSVGLWMACAVAFLCALNQGAGFLDRFRERPPTHEKYATKEELHEVKVEVGHLRAELKQDHKSFVEKNSEEHAGLYRTVNTVAAAVARIEGKLEGKK